MPKEINTNDIESVLEKHHINFTRDDVHGYMDMIDEDEVELALSYYDDTEEQTIAMLIEVEKQLFACGVLGGDRRFKRLI